MKKNGFIATSLIYSFFLIFVTLFLTIIADYLQNKVLLNTIEKGIKDEINNSMGIKDFEVGDMVSFVEDIDNPVITNQWIVVNINYISKQIILYSYDFTGNIPAGFSVTINNLEKSNFENDIEFGYQNNTYYNKIIYTFTKNDGTNSDVKEYKIDTNSIVSKKCTLEEVGSGIKYNFNTYCIKAGDTSVITRQRKRMVFDIGDSNYNSKTDDAEIILLDVV